MSISIKEEWIKELFIHNDDVYIDKVLYFDSKMYYCGKHYNEYFMVYFGHSQPSISNIVNYYNCSYNTIVEFIKCNETDIPSTAVNIEDVVEVIYNSTINDQTSNIIGILSNNDNAKVLSMKIKKLMERLLESSFKQHYSTLSNIPFYKSIQEHDELALLASYHLYNNYALCKDYHINNFPGILGLVYLNTSDCEDRLKRIIDNHFNNLKNSNDIEYHTLVIGHAIKIGEINRAFISTRYSSISDSGLVDQFQNSIETDNYYRYRNVDRIDNALHDSLFSDIDKELDDNYEMLKINENDDIIYQLDIKISDSIKEFENNKFQQILEIDDENDQEDLYDEIIDYIEDYDKKNGTDSDLWILDGLKHFKGE